MKPLDGALMQRGDRGVTSRKGGEIALTSPPSSGTSFESVQVVWSPMQMTMRLVLVAALFLAGCGGNPFGGTSGGGGVDPDPDPSDVVALQLAGSLGSASVSGNDLQITLIPFDNSAEFTATFVRNAALDVSGYQAYTPVVSPAINRSYIAYRATAGGAIALIVADGGRGVDAFGGAGISRTGLFTAPARGQATYRGGYVGLRVQDPTVNALPPDRVQGDVQIDADFVDSQVEGSISNRVNLDDPDDTLSDRFLAVTEIADDGTFTGEVQVPGDVVVGNYTGAFSTNASAVVGVVAIDESNPNGFQDDVTEYGLFALTCTLDAPVGSVCP
jgi:hypothetical protein